MLGLLTAPAIFSAMVVSVENAALHPLASWRGGLFLHWGIRVLHVFGAGIVFAVALLLVVHPRPNSNAARLGGFIRAGLWFQVVVGVALLVSLPHSPSLPAIAALLIALAAAGIVANQVGTQSGRNMARPRARGISALLLVLLTGMLTARQLLQEQALLPMSRKLQAQAAPYAALLGNAPSPAPPSTQPVFSQPAVVYAESCSFCHGAVGNGKGDEAARLKIPPENLIAVRSSPSNLLTLLRKGVPGSAMPSFDYYTEWELLNLIGFLGELGLRPFPEPLSVSLSPQVLEQARAEFALACASCHGLDGRGNPAAAPMLPTPPDLRRLNVSPQHAFQIITAGYPGTAMRSFTNFTSTERWGLAGVVTSLYKSNPAN